MGTGRIGGNELDDMAVVQLAHGQGLLAQVVNSEAAAPVDALARKADRVMSDLLDATKGAEAQVVELDEPGVEALRIGAVEKGLLHGPDESQVSANGVNTRNSIPSPLG